MTKFSMGPAGSHDSRGQPYVTYAAFGRHNEGDAWPTFQTEAEAWGMMLQTLGEVLRDATEVEFRTLPELTQAADGRCYVRARLNVLERAA